MDTLEKMVQVANQQYPGGCPACKGIRFRRCQACGGEINSYGDFRDSSRPRQVYETKQEWEAVNGKSEPTVPDRNLQP